LDGGQQRVIGNNAADKRVGASFVPQLEDEHLFRANNRFALGSERFAKTPRSGRVKP
jgi:hypothetical protein